MHMCVAIYLCIYMENHDYGKCYIREIEEIGSLLTLHLIEMLIVIEIDILSNTESRKYFEVLISISSNLEDFQITKGKISKKLVIKDNKAKG